MKYNKYQIQARFFPAIITSLPFVILSSFVLTGDYIQLFENFKYLKLSGLISIPFVFFFLFSHLNRYIAKEVFQKIYFKDELEMPTTIFLLNNDNTFSNEYKSSIKVKATNEFSVLFPSIKEESTDLNNVKRRISEIVGLIRNKVGAGKLLLQHNIEYGFVRNIIGGAPISLLMTIGNVYIFYNLIDSEPAFILSIILLVFYVLILLLSKFLINSFGRIYAKRLFQEYLS